MSIYKELLEAVDNGAKFKVDLINKSLWINKKQYIREGENIYGSYYFIEPYDLSLQFSFTTDENPWKVVEILYKEFKHSVPSKHMEKSYFKALPAEELTDRELAVNYDRHFANAMLTGYILLASLQGWLTWENENNWFWQSQEDPDLVILRNWIK